MSLLRMTQEQHDAHQERVKGARVVRFDVPEVKPKREPKTARKSVPRKPRPKYDYEKQLALQLTMLGFREFEVDARYLTDRLHRADILFRKGMLVVEIQGAAHRIRDKWQRDIEKAQLTLMAGFRLLPVSTKQVRDGTAAELVRRAVDYVGKPPF